MNILEKIEKFKENLAKSDNGLEMTRAMVERYFAILDKPGHEANVLTLKSIINDLARAEWGDNTAVLFNGDNVVIENFDGRHEILNRKTN